MLSYQGVIRQHSLLQRKLTSGKGLRFSGALRAETGWPDGMQNLMGSPE